MNGDHSLSLRESEGWVLELYLWSFLCASISLEVAFDAETEYISKEVGRETANGNIVSLCCFIEQTTGLGDTVLGAFELCLQFAELLIGLQVGIVLGDGEQASQSLADFALCSLVFSQLLGGEILGIYGDLGSLAASSDDGLQSPAFVSSITLDGIDEVGDEVCATLVLSFDVSPCTGDVLVLADEAVVGVATIEATEDHDGSDDEIDA